MPWISNDPQEAGYLAEIDKLPDRTVGLIGVVLVERRLKMAIQSKWQDGPQKQILGQLFSIKSQGPLANVGTQINIGFAIGLYDWNTRNDFAGCVAIRNSFAHRLDARDFSSPTIKDKIQNLRLPDIYPAQRLPKTQPPGSEQEWRRVLHATAVPDLDTTKGHFLRTLEILITILWKHLGFPARLGEVRDDA